LFHQKLLRVKVDLHPLGLIHLGTASGDQFIEVLIAVLRAVP